MASNSTISITFRLDGDNKGFKSLIRDTDGLRKAMSSAITEASRLDTKLVNFAAISTVVSGTQSAITSLTSALRGYTDAYAVQSQAEAQLEEVMRQRMNASAAEVQSIKDLASAQQQLGVIGDEVQLSGAQQVATFLTQKSSIETLLPAMNDLLAQQKGLNATSGDAVSIANLMGKAMQGQTSALTRVGITFNAAQEQIMKYGDEQTRAATLAQIITDNVGHMNAKLAQTDSGKLQQVKNTLGDIGEEVGRLANSAMPFLSMAAAATTALGGVIKLVTGIKAGVAVVTSWNLRSKAMIVMCRLMGVEATRSAAVVRVFSSALRGGAYSATAFKLAIRGLLISTVVGAAIVALTMIVEHLVTALDKASDSTDELIDAEKRAKREAEEMAEAQHAEETTLKSNRAALQMNISRLKEFNGTKADEKKIVREMNETYGETMGYFSSVSEWYKALVANSEAYCRQMVLEARTRMLANQIAQKEQENYAITHNEDGTQRTYSTRRKTELVGGRANTYSAPGMAVETAQRREIVGSSAQEKAQAAYDANTASIKALTEELDKAVKQSGAITYKVKGSAKLTDTETTSTNDKLTDRQRADLVDIGEVMSRNLESVSDYDKALEDLRLKQKYVSAEEYSAIQQNIDAVEQQRNAFIGLKGTLTELERAEAIDVTEVMARNKASVTDYDSALDDLRLKQKYASSQEYVSLQRNITMVEMERDAFTRLGQTMVESTKADAVDVTEVLSRNLQSVADYDRAIQDLHAKQRTATQEEYKSLQQNINALEQRREAFTKLRTPVNESAATLRDISANISALTEDLQDATAAEAALINKQIEAWNRKADAIRKAGESSAVTFDTFKSGWGTVKNLDGALSHIGETLKGNSTIWQKTTAIVDGFITICESIRSIVGIVQLLTDASKAHMAAKVAETGATLGNTTAVAAAAAEAPVAAAAEIPLIAANKAAAASFLEMATAAYFAAHAYIPFAGFGIGSGFATSAAAMVKSMGLMAFANGGIAYGPTLGLFGEYAGASHNPEVVAPLDKLKDLIGGTAPSELKVTGKLVGSGRTLYAIIENEASHIRRNG